MSRIVVLSPSEYLSIFKVMFDPFDALEPIAIPAPFVNHMNYQQLNVEVGPIFRRSLKFRPAPVGARSDLISAIRLRQTKVPRAKSNATDFEQADLER
jgi:hypothetical protein